ncbi:hypothetical protein NECAME_16438 [Necator americanus]|uniref:Uncharacterized protein n=1 Tax=Necator americanus TaxID=51031 RepID=W2TWU4_NECAM|nr:hypothetical protein NECAME_16438 [Necator americanus]ETN86278.1 hypothetical protein NECAME_16438 [Necator americanus]
MTGRGYMDTCGKSLSAAVDDSQWKGWADEDISKVYRFYLLRTQGFGVGNHELQNYVNKIIESRHSKKAAQTFYCESILKGVVSWAGDDLTTACHLIFPDLTDRKRISRAREILESEMRMCGFALHLRACLFPSARHVHISAAHWKGFFASAIDEMEAVYLTERQFVDVRNRLKGRISGDLVLGETPTGIIRPGEPLVNDISDVHRRPIMSKMDSTGELPKEEVEEISEVEESSETDSEAPVGAGFNDLASVEEAHVPKRDIGNFEPEEHRTVEHTADQTTTSTSEPQTSPMNEENQTSQTEKEERKEKGEKEEVATDTQTAPQQSSSLNLLMQWSYVVVILFLVFTFNPQQL